MLIIENIYIENIAGKSRLIFDLKLNDKEKQVWYEVDEEYGKYLCHERCDAIVIGLLNYAMRYNHNIESKIPITEELLYNLETHLIPTLAKTDKKLHNITISAPIETECIKNSGGVGTGCSCGVDSFHAILNHYNTKFKGHNLTHLCINSVGSFHKGYAKYGMDKARDDVRSKAMEVAKELNLPLIITDSNIKKEFNIYFAHNHTYYSMFAVYCMQKLWNTYYYGSGVGFEEFSLKDNSTNDTAYYDLLLLQCLSSHNIRLHSEGATKDRLEKTKFISNNKIVQKHLHVCCAEGSNCGVCLKCRRTLLTLEILGKLEDFRQSFDIDYYKSHRKDYLKWLYKNGRDNNAVLRPIYLSLKKEFNPVFKFKYWTSEFFKKIISIEKRENRKIIKFLGIKISFKTH